MGKSRKEVEEKRLDRFITLSYLFLLCDGFTDVYYNNIMIILLESELSNQEEKNMQVLINNDSKSNHVYTGPMLN